jgi:hypothetical protein
MEREPGITRVDDAANLICLPIAEKVLGTGQPGDQGFLRRRE